MQQPSITGSKPLVALSTIAGFSSWLAYAWWAKTHGPDGLLLAASALSIVLFGALYAKQFSAEARKNQWGGVIFALVFMGVLYLPDLVGN